ncbi:MAG: manganese efflux pump MntP family protein [Lachnospirales bacterium]
MVFFVAIGLAVDALSVAISIGGNSKNKPIMFGIYFGGFQFIMTLLGFFVGGVFEDFLLKYSSYISAIIFVSLGIKMLNDVYKNQDNNNDDELDVNLPLLALATSIDAFAVGITYSVSNENIYINALIIGIVAFVLSTLGAKLSKMLYFLMGGVEIFGAVVLILLGVLALI